MDDVDDSDVAVEWGSPTGRWLREPTVGDVFLVHYNEKVKERHVYRVDGEDVHVAEYILTVDGETGDLVEKWVSFLTTKSALYDRMRAGDIEWYANRSLPNAG